MSLIGILILLNFYAAGKPHQKYNRRIINIQTHGVSETTRPTRGFTYKIKMPP